MNKKRIIIGSILIALIVIAVAAGAFYFGTDSQARGRLLSQLDIEARPAEGRLVASGFIEAEEIDLAPEIGGRVVLLPLEEGDDVVKGDLVAQLDTSILEAQRSAAEAQLAIAIAQRDLLEAGTRDEIIREAEAQVAIAQASLAAAQVSLQGAYSMRSNPQGLQIQVAEASAQTEIAQHRVNAANAQLLTANKQLELYHATVEGIEGYLAYFRDDAEDVWVPLEQAQAPNRYSAASQQVGDAQNALARANEFLASAQNLASDPQAIQAQVINANTALTTAEAELTRAQAQLEDLKAGPTREEMAVADGRVEEAEAALKAIETQIERMAIFSPIGGVVLERPIHVGELAVPGVPVMTVANLDVVELTVYIAADQFNRVALNQEVSVRVDSFPARSFAGTIVYISDEAEFTPRNVQTREERVNLVYAVKIRIENASHALKPGMPADAYFDS